MSALPEFNFAPRLRTITKPCPEVSHDIHLTYFMFSIILISRSQWPRDLRRGSTGARLLGLWVRIPSGHGSLSLLNVVCFQVEVSAMG